MNDPADGNFGVVVTGQAAELFICLGCNLELELRTGKKSPTFAEVPRLPIAMPSRVGQVASLS